MNHINVITLGDESLVNMNTLFTGPKAVKKAEAYFIKKIKELKSDVDGNIIEDALDDGYFEYNGFAVVISWPEVIIA
jgi:hypothetical protein